MRQVRNLIHPTDLDTTLTHRRHVESDLTTQRAYSMISTLQVTITENATVPPSIEPSTVLPRSSPKCHSTPTRRSQTGKRDRKWPRLTTPGMSRKSVQKGLGLLDRLAIVRGESFWRTPRSLRGRAANQVVEPKPRFNRSSLGEHSPFK